MKDITMSQMHRVRRAMKAAAHKGYDPRNSHAAQGKAYQQIFQSDAMRLAREEAAARVTEFPPVTVVNGRRVFVV